ncbi:DNA polymerase III subunit chi [wastewater metagenome]|uniref:DNA polymerase III subunit chi n=2 Tax=unclassified sequences TaxID=12908 RepID=A0A5B8RC15_9ZZZZ|nr:MULTISPECIES: DNA polymerase III subunit chi [Arhodomonas]MCS4505181.1 DNA polymerase III subunit chi [Arhodomonas aquaeolei]QEA05448.1 DNA polymerase III subunit chi [uncultured organism]
MQVDFYILGEAGAEARAHFACRLAEKAYRGAFGVTILAGDSAAAAQLDDMLWSFRQGSFVPHALAREADDTDAVVIAWGSDVPRRDVLVNLTDAIPPDWQGFERVAEIVTADDETRRPARARFRSYRDAGVTPTNHTL